MALQTKQKPANKTLRILRIVARVWGSLALAIILLFFLGDILISDPGPGPTLLELIGFAFIPLGLVIGLLLSYKYELTGGLITILSWLIHNSYKMLTQQTAPFNFFLSGPFLIAVSPGLLYLIYGLISRRK